MRYAMGLVSGVTLAVVAALIWRTKWAGRRVVALFARGD